MNEPTRREQHLVSRGYQRNVAAGLRIAVLDISTCTVVEAKSSIKTNWRAKDFLSVVTAGEIDDRLKKEFAKDEQVILNSIRDIMPFREITPRQRTSLDRLAAIYLTRSHAFRDAHIALVEDYLPAGVLELASKAEVSSPSRRIAIAAGNKLDAARHQPRELHAFKNAPASAGPSPGQFLLWDSESEAGRPQ